MSIFININGGYGRVLCATGVIREFKEKNPDTEINIITGFPEIFINNPFVNKSYSLNHEYLFEDHIKNNIYKEPEPYKLQKYIDGTLHLAEGFSYELLGEEKYIKPEIYLKEDELDEAEHFIKTIPKPVILFQPFGSSGGKSRDGVKILPDPTHRSIPTEIANEIYKRLEKEGFQVIYIRSQDQAGFKNWMTLPPMPFRKIIALIPFVEGAVCCDSALQHAFACFEKPAIVLWGSTNSNQLGHKTNINFEGQARKIQYNPVRMPSNDFDADKRYKNVWDYLNNTTINKIIKFFKEKTKT